MALIRICLLLSGIGGKSTINLDLLLCFELHRLSLVHMQNINNTLLWQLQCVYVWLGVLFIIM